MADILTFSPKEIHYLSINLNLIKFQIIQMINENVLLLLYFYIFFITLEIKQTIIFYTVLNFPETDFKKNMKIN